MKTVRGLGGLLGTKVASLFLLYPLSSNTDSHCKFSLQITLKDGDAITLEGDQLDMALQYSASVCHVRKFEGTVIYIYCEFTVRFRYTSAFHLRYFRSLQITGNGLRSSALRQNTL